MRLLSHLLFFSLLILALSIFCGQTCAQQTSQSQFGLKPANSDFLIEQPYHSKLLPVQLWDDLTYLTSQPDFYLVVGGLGLSPSLLGKQFETESAKFSALEGNSELADNLFEPGEWLGDAIVPVAAGFGSWAFGHIAGDSEWREFGSDLIRVQAINGLMTGAVKYGVDRTRPNGSAYSFPSGHTSSAFATAGVVYRHFGKTWGTMAFAMASYVGISRLQENKHYTSDIVAGAILGTYLSLKLANRERTHGPLRIKPTMVNGGYGLKLSMKF